LGLQITRDTGLIRLNYKNKIRTFPPFRPTFGLETRRRARPERSRIGRVWREADYEATDFENVVTDLLEGQHKNPVGIFAFNTAEGWSRDVSADIAAELRRR